VISFLSVFIGGGLGASLRYLFSILLEPYGVFPHLVPNVIGAFLIGFVSMRLGFMSKDFTLLFVVGFLGGFTTFSGYIHFLTQTSLPKAAMYLVSHYSLGIGLFLAGVELSKLFFKSA
jgi:CrcB protein